MSKNKKPIISPYNKKEILTVLKETNCNPHKAYMLNSRFQTLIENPGALEEFVNTHAKKSQTRINNCMRIEENQTFMNLNKCAENLCKQKLKNLNENVFSVALEVIANTEAIPDPDELDGIDLRKLYKLLANLMAGYPTESVDGATKLFLEECYNELMNNTESWNVDSFKDIINQQDSNAQQVNSWLTNSDYKEYLEKIFEENWIIDANADEDADADADANAGADEDDSDNTMDE